MNIEQQLKTARKAVRRQAEGLQNTWELPITWFQDFMVSEVFGYLLKGRMKHDSYQKPCSFNALWNDVLDAGHNALFNDKGKYFFNDFYVTLSNIKYHIEEWPENGWHAEPAISNISRNNIPGYVRLSSESFIRFMEEFDQVIPMIHAEAEILHSEVAKKEYTDNILLSSLESIVDEALRETDITYSYELKNSDIIFRFWLQGHTGLRVRIPSEQYATRIMELPTLLKNPEEGIKKYGKDFRYERLKK